MDETRLQPFVRRVWDESILARLHEYVRIPNKSPMFDPQWEQHGYMEAAVRLMHDWCKEQPIPGMSVSVRRLPGKTPLLFIAPYDNFDEAMTLINAPGNAGLVNGIYTQSQSEADRFAAANRQSGERSHD